MKKSRERERETERGLEGKISTSLLHSKDKLPQQHNDDGNNLMWCVCARQEFAQVARRPWLVALGATLQYTIMPLMGFTVSRLLNLPVPYAVGYAHLPRHSLGKW